MTLPCQAVDEIMLGALALSSAAMWHGRHGAFTCESWWEFLERRTTTGEGSDM